MWDILLAFQDTSVNEHISSQGNITGLTTIVKYQPLDFVYKLSVMTDPTVITKSQNSSKEGGK